MEKLEYDKDNLLKQPWEHYLKEFQDSDPREIAERTGFPYDEEQAAFTVTFWKSKYKVTWPDFEVTHLPDDAGYYPLEDMMKAKILTLRILLRSTASQGTGTFKTYREMPWGEVYLRQFDGRCIKRLAFTYGNRLGDFVKIMDHIKAEQDGKTGDAAYKMEVYPGYQVKMILWAGDEEFPPASQFLFSDNFPLGFEAEDIAQMGDILISSLKAWEKSVH